MGAWNHLESRLRTLFKKEIRYAGRRAAASPATGALAIHTLEQNQLLASAFSFKSPSIPNPQSPIPPGTRSAAAKTSEASVGAVVPNRPIPSSKTSVGPRSKAAAKTSEAPVGAVIPNRPIPSSKISVGPRSKAAAKTSRASGSPALSKKRAAAKVKLKRKKK